jgi:hypothetical protein
LKGREDIALDARHFFNIDNKIFCKYCQLLDLDPEAVSESFKKRIDEFDRSVLTFKMSIG